MKIHHLLTFLNSFLIVSFIVTISVLWVKGSVPVELVTTSYCDHQTNDCETHYDAINIAVQLGRLDVVSVVLAMLAAAVGLTGFFGFIFVRERSEIIAKQTALSFVEKDWENWKKNELPKEVAKGVENYLEIYDIDIEDEDADDIAASIETGDEDGK